MCCIYNVANEKQREDQKYDFLHFFFLIKEKEFEKEKNGNDK